MAEIKEMLVLTLTILMIVVLSDGKGLKHAKQLECKLPENVLLRYFAVQSPNVCATTKDEPLSEYLWQSTQTEKLESLNSNFMQGLKNGTLDPVIFGGYVVQDCIYCYYVKQFIDIAVNKTTDTELRKILEKRSASLERYYRGLFEVWHIGDPSGITLNEACADYLGQLKNVAVNMSPLYFVVTLIPCAKLWPWLGKEISDQQHNFGVYESWVKENLNSSSVSYKALDRVIDDKSSLIDKKLALALYRNMMQAEANFFKSVFSNL